MTDLAVQYPALNYYRRQWLTDEGRELLCGDLKAPDQLAIRNLRLPRGFDHYRRALQLGIGTF